MNDELIFTIAVAALFIGYFIYQVYSRQNKLKLVDDFIRDYYREKGQKVDGISKHVFPVIPNLFRDLYVVR